MGRLNANANANAALSGMEFPAPVRYNSLQYTKGLKSGQFPAEPTNGQKDSYQELAAVNKIRFRCYWDAELRASVYLNEFLTENTGWFDRVHKTITDMHEHLKSEKGAQLREVLEVADERDERYSEIIDQHGAEGVIKYYLGMLMIDPASAPATYQLIRVARRVGEVVVMCLKERFQEARPSQVCPAIIPLIDPPVTPAFPAGHALQSHLISMCLKEADRLQNQGDMLFYLSSRIAENRVVAGLHYPLDNAAGVTAAKECFELLREGTKFKKLLKAVLAESYLERNPEKSPEPDAALPEDDQVRAYVEAAWAASDLECNPDERPYPGAQPRGR